ncbi:MAG: hypothetical protein ACREU8_00060 [Gammaproteobacteria bacterium]
MSRLPPVAALLRNRRRPLTRPRSAARVFPGVPVTALLADKLVVITVGSDPNPQDAIVDVDAKRSISCANPQTA